MRKKFVAIRLDENGKERLGSDNAIFGDYQSFANFRRYTLSKFPGTYNVYIINSSTSAWNLYYSGWREREISLTNR